MRDCLRLGKDISRLKVELGKIKALVFGNGKRMPLQPCVNVLKNFKRILTY